MYDNKFKKFMYDYAIKNGKNVNNLTSEDYDRILNEIADKSFVEEYLSFERKEILNPMLKKAREILYSAYQASSEESSKELAELAYKTSQECFEALNMWYNLEEDQNKKLSILNEGISYEEEKLKRLGYFEDEYIGKFYDEIETRNYLRILRNKIDVLLFVGRIGLAKEICLDVLKLNKNDDLGVRYVLLGIYAYQENEKKLLELKNQLNEDSIETLLPLLILYYKLDKMNEVDNTLSEIRKISSDFIPFFKKYLSDCRNEKLELNVEFSESILSVMNSVNFLINTTPGLVFYIGLLE